MSNREKEREFSLKTGPIFLDLEDDEFELEPCHFCDGDGWGIIGVNWDCDDPINGPYDGEIEQCPCCGGSGLENDAMFW